MFQENEARKSARRARAYLNEYGDHEDGRYDRSQRCRVMLMMSGLLLVATLIAFFVFNGDKIASELRGNTNLVDHPKYEVLLHSTVDEIQADVVVYRHKDTLTPVMTVIPVDTSQDAALGVSFRTIPTNDHGAAHVLEHSVLAGSQSYPVKDPFYVLKRGSLHTFLNAFTVNDRTMYAVASRNAADFHNLMSVYFDAVFKPRVVTDEGKWIYRQEGWRIERDADDGDLEFNGVVLSEMKGAYSDPGRLMYSHIQQELFPESPYRFNAGGDPKQIPNLTHPELVDFYNRHYHPTNAKVFVYGSIERAADCLTILNGYLEGLEPRIDLHDASRVEWQTKKDLVSMERRRFPYPSQDANDHRVVVSWLLNEAVSDTKTRLVWMVLNQLLMRSELGVLWQPLTESGLGNGMIGGGYDNALQQSTFSVGLKGVADPNVTSVENLIMNALDTVAQQGFHPDDIESAMNSMEFALRNIATGQSPRGISLFIGTMKIWNYDLDPLSAFEFEEELKSLRDEISESGSDVFTNMVREYLVDNLHKVVIELFPDPTLADAMLQDEQDRISAMEAALGPESFQALLDEADNLAQIQATEDPPEAIATIPMLTIDELDRVGDEYPIQVDQDVESSGVTVLTHEVPASYGIAMIDIGFDISAVDFDDVPLLQLFAALLWRAGTSEMSGKEFAREVGANTGGLMAYTMIDDISNPSPDGNYQVSNQSRLATNLIISGQCTHDKAADLLSLSQQIIMDAKLDDKDSAIQFLTEWATEMEAFVVSSGNKFVDRHMEARYSVLGFVEEQMMGIASLPKLHELLETAEADWPQIYARLEAIRTAIFGGHRNGIFLSVTGDESVLTFISPAIRNFLRNQLPPITEAAPFPDFAVEDHPWAAVALERMPQEAPQIDEGFVAQTGVNYVGQAGLLFQSGEEIYGSSAVLAQYLSTGYLHEQLRAQRGAYGAAAWISKGSGLLRFASYRDPNLVETLNVYAATAATLRAEFADADSLPIEAAAAVIGTMGLLDGSAPQFNAVGKEATRQWLRRETPELRNNWRAEILSTSVSDFLEYADRLESWSMPTIAVIGSQAAFDEAAAINYTMTMTDLTAK